MASVSCVAVLALGNFLGATVKGVTGFGSAILNLCVWVAFTCVGVDGGTLQQAVVSECLCSEALAIPLLFMTHARQTCDWRLVTSLSIFGAVGAPIGAALLTNLQPRYVEFVMSCVLLLVIVLHCKVPQRILEWYSIRRSQACGGTALAECEVILQQKLPGPKELHSFQPDTELIPAAAPEDAVNAEASVAEELYQPSDCLSNNISSPLQPAELLTQGSLLAAVEHISSRPAKKLVLDSDDGPGLTSRTSSGTSIDAAACISLVDSSRTDTFPAQQEPTTLDYPGASLGADQLRDVSDKQPLLAPSLYTHSSSSVPVTEQGSQHASSLKCCRNILAGCVAAVKEWWAHSNQPEQRAAIIRTFLIGSAAGTASGVMAGMTGMGGPPVMYMFDKLNVPKDTVRGSNAVTNVLQFRIIAYALMGALVPADWVLYVTCSVAALVGMCWGNKMAAGMNQQAFSKMMVLLMVLCCVLLFASSAGLAGN